LVKSGARWASQYHSTLLTIAAISFQDVLMAKSPQTAQLHLAITKS